MKRDLLSDALDSIAVLALIEYIRKNIKHPVVSIKKTYDLNIKEFSAQDGWSITTNDNGTEIRTWIEYGEKS